MAKNVQTSRDQVLRSTRPRHAGKYYFISHVGQIDSRITSVNHLFDRTVCMPIRKPHLRMGWHYLPPTADEPRACFDEPASLLQPTCNLTSSECIRARHNVANLA